MRQEPSILHGALQTQRDTETDHFGLICMLKHTTEGKKIKFCEDSIDSS